MIGARDITAALAGLGVRPDDTVFVHSTLRSSLRVEGRTIADKTEAVSAGLAGAVPDGRLIMPTFTYSYTKGEDYDRAHSPSTVGALTEAFRRSPETRRTADPLFSTAIRGPLDPAWEDRLMTVGDTDAFGPDSVFGLIEEVDGVLLFYGVELGFATHVHYVEQSLGVPYRYPKPFPGTVVDAGARTPTTATYFVRDLEGDVVPYFDVLERDLRASGAATAVILPDGPELLVVRASAVADGIRAGRAANPDYLLARGHTMADTR